MTRRQRLRRTGIICLHFLRNLAYYRSWNAAPLTKRREQFWRSINANFIDVAVLEWCKLYGDLNAKHHWTKCVADQDDFIAGLINETGLTMPEFEAYRIEIRTYRDKFVAHLDELNEMQIPNIQPALESVRYLYKYLLDKEDDVGAFVDAPQNANVHFQKYLTEGRVAHRT